MKLIIDIPKNAYDLLQGEGVDWLGAEHILDAVAKGKPVEECEDCVSLDAVIDVFDTWWMNKHELDNAIKILEDKLNALPHVIPTEKVGQWIYDRTKDWDGECKYECSECGMGSDVDYAYCMRCGCKMQGVEG